jgi:hypothetical protein
MNSQASQMLDQAEAQYKARASVDDESDDATKAADLARLGQLAQDFNNRQIPGDTAGNATRPFQHLVAALTYADTLEAMSADGEYVARTRQALDTLHTTVTTTVANGDVTSVDFRSIGQSVTIPTVSSGSSQLPGLSSGHLPARVLPSILEPSHAGEESPGLCLASTSAVATAADLERVQLSGLSRRLRSAVAVRIFARPSPLFLRARQECAEGLPQFPE